MATSDPLPSNLGESSSLAHHGVEDSEALSSLLMLAKSNARLDGNAEEKTTVCFIIEYCFIILI